MTSLSPRQLKGATRLLLQTAEELCALCNQHPNHLMGCDERRLSGSIKGVLLRSVIFKLGSARGLFNDPTEGTCTEGATLLARALAPLTSPLLCEELGLCELDAQRLSACHQRYTRGLDELLTADQSWALLTESTLGALSEALTGFSVRRLTTLSCALDVGRGQRRWLSLSELKRATGRRPTLARLRERLGVSTTLAQRAIKPHPQARARLASLSEMLTARGVEPQVIDELCRALEVVYRLLSTTRSGLPMVGLRGELIWEQGAQRRQRGVHYTPTWLAQEAVSLLSERLHRLDGLSPQERLERLCATRICDPAVGGGVFLIEHIRALVERHGQGALSPETLRVALVKRAVYGVDIDPRSVEVTRASLWLLARSQEPLKALEGHVRCADSLGELPPRWGDRQANDFDLVICNPPYLNGVEGSWKASPAQKRRLKRLYPHSAVGTYDSAELFWERCCQLLGEGGRYALLLPTVQLMNQGPFKRWLHERWRPVHLKLYALQSFSAARVRTALVIGARGASERVSISSDDPQLPIKGTLEVSWRGGDENWYTRLSQASAPLGALALDVHVTRLSDRFHVHAGCATGAAYELVSAIQDQRREEGAGPMLITTGLIERYHHLWGQREARYLKRDYLHPRWPTAPAPKSLSAALFRQRQPKVLVAGLSAVLEATCDLNGDLAGVVQTWVLRPTEAGSIAARAAQCELLCVYLNSAALSYHFVERYGAAAMSGRQITVKKKALLSLPLPALSEPEALATSLTTSLAADQETHSALLERLSRQESVDEHLQARSQEERDRLTVLTHRALSSCAPGEGRWHLNDRLAHSLVSVSYGHPSAPLLAWWRARSGQG